MNVEQIKKPRNANGCCIKRRALTPYGVFWIGYVVLAIMAMAWSLS